MENFKRDIFEQLGNLFYALASDQHVSPVASGELKMLVKEDWLTEPSHPSADKVSEASHLIGLTIDSLQGSNIPASDAYSSFSAFYKKHEEQFSAALKQRVIETANAIVDTFPSQKSNKHLGQLKTLFEQPTTTGGFGR